MAEGEKAGIRIKKVVRDGVVLDILLLMISGCVIDDGSFSMLIGASFIVHWLLNGAILLSPRAPNSRAGQSFIQAGLLFLAPTIFLTRLLLWEVFKFHG